MAEEKQQLVSSAEVLDPMAKLRKKIEAFGSERNKQTLKCLHCGTEYKVHNPIMIQQETEAYSIFELVPSWSLDERICPNCGTVHLPVIESVKMTWISANPADNQPKHVIPATGGKLSPEELAKLNHSLKMKLKG